MGNTALRTESLDAAGVAKLLTEYGQRLELAEENPYRARAYYKAAESLRALTTPLSDVIAQGGLRDIPGIGPAIAARIRTLHEAGTDAALEEMRRQVPAGVLEMLRIPGIRSRDVLRIHKGLDVASLDELENACRLDLLKDRKGLGAALQAKVLDGIELMRRSRGQMLLHRAADRLEAAIANLRRSHRDLSRTVAAGDVRRGCEVVADLALAAVARNGAEGSARLGPGIALHVAEPALYGVTLLRATGSAAHLRDLEAFAAERGLTLADNGLRRGRRAIPCPEESDVYAALGLPFIPPELREGRGEIALAAGGRLPRLVAAEDIRGLLHSHTNLSDGAHTLKQMTEATRKRGYAYFGVADHSQSAGYAGGLSVAEIEEQHAEINELNARHDGTFRIFKGIESDILADGSLDYPDDILARFDFVVASVHSRFRLDKRTQTERIVRAVSNPHTTILGHMTGRMLLRRPGYEVDIDEVLKACAAHRVCVEINGNPHRLDLDWRWHGRALELGCMMSINPDAHSIAELDLTRWGVLMARKGGVPKERVLNCLDLAAIADFLQVRKRSRSAGTAPERRIARGAAVKRKAVKPGRSTAKGSRGTP